MRSRPSHHAPVLAATLLALAAGPLRACPGDGPEASARAAFVSADVSTRAALERRDLARLESTGGSAGAPAFEAAAPAPPAAESCAPDVTPGTFSMLIELDPESHQWRLRAVPGPGEVAPVDDPSLERSFEGLVQEPLPGGGFMVDLRGRFMDHAVVKIDADGRPVYGCVSTMEAAERWMQVPAAPPAPRKK